MADAGWSLGRATATAARYFHTLRYLRPQQLFGRVWYQLHRPRLSNDDLPGKRLPPGRLREVRLRRPSMTSPGKFIFLNEPGQVTDARDWNHPKRDKLWLYNLHYFDDLNAEGFEMRDDWHRALVARWIAENPPVDGNGWEPYPVSLRAVNWLKWDLRSGGLDESAQNSLALQLRWLRRRLEYHILGNHLVANAKALIFGGLYFDGSEADQWFDTGMRIFNEQLDEQILGDGGHFELSPMYHLIVLEDVLDVINVLQAYDRPVPEAWFASVGSMFAWADAMCHPDGEVSFFNDSAFGVAGTVAELREYAARLMETDGHGHSPDSTYLRESGYARLETTGAVLLFDAAAVGPDYLPGHAHADTLSLEMSLFGHRLFVNSGTSVYGTGTERLRQRGTDTHNTLVIDGENSSEVWSGFRVARRARVHDVECSVDERSFAAEHDGYRRLPGRPIHRRAVRLTDGRLEVVDTVRSVDRTRKHAIQGAWHLHPDVSVSGVRTHDGHTELTLSLPAAKHAPKALLRIHGAQHVKVEESTWHPEFGHTMPSHRIAFSYSGSVPIRIKTDLRWETTCGF